MLCISVHQPWAFLIIQGLKDIENRDWPTKVRGRVLIHACKTMSEDDYETALLVAERVGVSSKMPSREAVRHMLGGIVGSVEIVDCVAASASPWFFGKFGFVLRNPIAMPFRPFRGALGFFDVPEAA